jgi:MFS family permease
MKNIDKNVIYLGWVSFFTDMASSMVTTLLPIFVVYVLNEGIDKLGIVIASATFISYILRILFGYLSDKYSIVKPFVVSGYFISAITKPLLAFSSTYIDVVALRGVERIGKAIRSASKDSLISYYVKEKSHGRTFGFHKMMDIAGELTGALIIFTIFMFLTRDENVIRDIFAFTIIPGFISTFIVLVYVKDSPQRVKTPTNIVNKDDYKIFMPLFVYFGFLFFMMSEQFFILRVRDIGYTIEMIPLFMILLTFTQAVTSYFSGMLSDYIGIYKSLIISFVFGLISILMLNVNLWLSFVFLALFTVLSLNSIRSYISQNAKSKGYVYGVFYGGIAFSSASGALVIGFIWNSYGFEKVILFSEVGISFMLLLMLLIKKKLS